MSLPRSIQTRLLEACAREAKACFSQPDLGLASLYSSQGSQSKMRIYPWGVIEGSSIYARQINIVVEGKDRTLGIGGATDTEYTAAFSFYFPPDTNEFAVGGTTFWDEVAALELWLILGGTVPNPSPGRLEDPDWDHIGESRFLTTGIKQIANGYGFLKGSNIWIDLRITFTASEDKFGNLA